MKHLVFAFAACSVCWMFGCDQPAPTSGRAREVIRKEPVAPTAAPAAKESVSDSALQAFLDAIGRTDTFVLHEGLPHHHMEEKAFEAERRDKAVRELHGYWFYQEPLTYTAEHSSRITRILTDPQTYVPFEGEKFCGGFHPDYALEWQPDTAHYYALICFGCDEVKLFGPDIESRYDLADGARQRLKTVLSYYHKNRPAYTP